MSEYKRDDIDEALSVLGADKLSRRKQGVLLGGVAAAAIFLTPFLLKSQIDYNRQQNTINQEQKVAERLDMLGKKYNVSHLTQESQAAFERLTQLLPDDIGNGNRYYSDYQQIGESLQQDIATLAAGLIAKGRVVDEYDLAKELIPDDSQETIAKAGFELTPLAPVHCDAGPDPSYRPFDYTNHLGREFKVRYKKDGRIISVPLGSKQTPAPVEDRPDWPFDAWHRDPFDPNLIQTSPLYKVAGCAILNTYTDDRKRPVKWVYSE